MRLWFLCCTLWPIVLSAQHLAHQKFDTENGLPSLQITELLEDQQGNIWVGTKTELSRFDGNRFTAFLKGHFITRLDHQNDTLWGISNRVVFRIVGDQVNEYPLPFRDDTTGCFLPLAAQRYIVGQFPSSENPGGYQMIVFNTQSLRFDTLAQVFPGRLLEKLDEETWLLANRDLSRFYFYHPKTKKQQPLSMPVNHYGWWHFVSKGKGGQLLKSDEQLWHYRSGRLIEAAQADSTLGVPLATQRGDIFYFPMERPHVLLNQRRYDFPACQPKIALEDRHGNCWLGTETGLYKIPAKPFFYFDAAQGLPQNNLWAFQYAYRRWWVGSYGSGLFSATDKDAAQFGTEKIPAAVVGQKYASSLDDFYFAMCQTPEQQLVMPHALGTFLYDQKTYTWLEKPNKTTQDAALGAHIDQNRREIIAFGVMGVRWFDFTGEQIHFLDRQMTGEVQNPIDVQPLGGDQYLLGFRNKTLRYDRQQNTLTPILTTEGDSLGFISIDKDPRGNLWGATMQDGLWLWENDTLKRICPDLLEGMTETVALVDQRRILLASHKKNGLLAIHVERFYRWRAAADKASVPNPFYWFDGDNGFAFRQEPQQNSLTTDLDNSQRVLFTTGDAKAYFFDIDTSIFDLPVLRPFVRQLEVFVADSLRWRTQGGRFFGGDTLYTHERSLRLQAHATTQHLPGQVRFAYRTRHRSQWTAWAQATDNQLLLPNLPPHYTELEIRAFYRFQTPAGQPHTERLFLHVVPFWWETLWGGVLIGLLLLGVIAGVFVLTKKRERERQRIQIAEKEAETRRKRMEDAFLQKQKADLRNEALQEEIVKLQQNSEEAEATLESMYQQIQLIEPLRFLGEEGEVFTGFEDYKHQMRPRMYHLLEELQKIFTHFRKVQEAIRDRLDSVVQYKNINKEEDARQFEEEMRSLYPRLIQAIKEKGLSSEQALQVMALVVCKGNQYKTREFIGGIAVNSLQRACARISKEKLALEKSPGKTYTTLVYEWARAYVEASP